MPEHRGKRIAIVGAGIAGLRCAEILKQHFDVEIFEAAEKNGNSRPLQMEGGVHYCAFVPDLEPTHPIKEITFLSENRVHTWKGKMGYTYMIGGDKGLDARLRRRIEGEVKIHYSTKVTSLDDLKEFDVIIGADGYKSNIARLAEMRERLPRLWGVGIGSTVKGDFEIGKMECTFNAEIAPGGYRYLIPISEKEATLASACIARKVDAKGVREKLRAHAAERGYMVFEEWTDFEKWYDFKSYQRDNAYIIGGAASFTDQCFGFGLKYSIESAKLCAMAIMDGKDYDALLRPMLKELRFWERIGTWFINATNRKYDRMMWLANIRFVRNRAQEGKSIKGIYRLLRLL